MANLSSAPLQDLDEAGLASGGRRFRFRPLRARLSSVSARHAALPPVPLPSEQAEDVHKQDGVEDHSFSHFADALARQAELDLTTDFTEYAERVAPLAASLPLVVHARKRILQATLAVLQPGTTSALAIADCLLALARDLGADMFYPAMPQLMAAIARLFGEVEELNEGVTQGTEKSEADSSTLRDESNGLAETARENETGEPNPKRRKKSEQANALNARLWDPSRTLMPIFNALARITKIVLQPLIRDPRSTFDMLYPLLAHKHYRIREMTAEASAAYLVRKTRDIDVLHALVDECLRNRHDMSVGGKEDVGMRDSESERCHALGAAAVIAEAVRGVAGGLHQRGIVVLRRVLKRALPSQRDTFCFCVAAHVFETVCSIVTDVDAAEKVARLLVDEAESCASRLDSTVEANTQRSVENACFFLGKWCSFQQGARVPGDDIPTQARRLSYSLLRMERVGDDVKRAALLVASATMSVKAQGVVSKEVGAEFVACTEGLSPALLGLALAETRKLLHKGCVKQNLALDVSGALCDRLAVHDVNHASMEALALTRAIASQGTSPADGQDSQLALCMTAPKLMGGIRTTLRKAVDEGQVEKNTETVRPEFRDRLRTALELCRWLRVPSTAQLLGRFVGSSQSSPQQDPSHQWDWDTDTTCLAVEAYVAQCMWSSDVEADDDDGTQVEFAKIFDAVMANPWHVASVRALGMLSVPVDSVPLGSTLDGVLKKLVPNFSSPSKELRIATAVALRRLSARTQGEDPRNELVDDRAAEQNDEDAEQVHSAQTVAELQANLDMHPTLGLLFHAIHAIQSAPPSIEHARKTGQLLSRLPSLCERIADKIDQDLFTELLGHVALGIWKDRFRMLWSFASDVCMRLVAARPHVMRPLLEEVLLSTRDAVLDCGLTDTVVGMDETVEAVSAEHEDEVPSSDVSPGTTGLQVVDHGAMHDEEEVGANIANPSQQGAGEAEEDLEGGPKTRPSRNRALPVGNPSEKVSGPSLPKEKVGTRSKGLVRDTWRHDQTGYSLQVGDCADTANASRVTADADKGSQRGIAMAIHLEIVSTISKRPELFFDRRPFLIQELYLRLDTPRMSRRVGTRFCVAYSGLLAALGGLKGTGNNKELERQMRARLLEDLCRSDSACQVSVLKCLMASRSPLLAPQRESLLRMADDKTFRDEASVLSTKLADAKQTAVDSTSKFEIGSLEDVLVRICYGKMGGRREKLAARRAAALSFVVSALSWSDAVPHMIDLALSGLKADLDSVLAAVEEGSSIPLLDSTTNEPLASVVRGVLGATDAILRQFGEAISSRSWQLIAAADLYVLGATSQHSAQAIRSSALRQLSYMMGKRPEETLPFAQPCLALIRTGRFDSSKGQDVTSAPALLVFLAAVARTSSSAAVKMILVHERWAFEWACEVAVGRRATPDAVCRALDVSGMAVNATWHSGEEDTRQWYEHKLTRTVSDRMHMIEAHIAEKSGLGTWKSTFDRTLVMVSDMSMGVLSPTDAEPLADSLVNLICTDSFANISVVRGILQTVAALFRRLAGVREASEGRHAGCSVGSSETASCEAPMKNHGVKLARLFSERRIIASPVEQAALCEVFSSTARKDLVIIGSVLADLTSMRSDRVDEADYDLRLSTFSEISKALKRAIEEKQPLILNERADRLKQAHAESALTLTGLTALCHACIRALKDTDTAVRGMAGYCLKLAATWSCSTSDHRDFVSELCRSLVDALMACSSVDERREVCGALGELVRRALRGGLADIADIAFLSPLVNAENEDQDFFENIAHLQAHRRSRALRQMSTILERPQSADKPANAGNLDAKSEANESEGGRSDGNMQALAERFALPLAYRISLESPAEDQLRTSKHDDPRRAARADVARWAAAACGAASGRVGERAYVAYFERALRRLRREKDESKQSSLYSIIIAMADALPTTLERCRPELMEFVRETALPEMLRHVSAGATEGDVLGSVIANQRRQMSTAGAGGLGRHGGVVFRAPLAVASARMMTQLDQAELEETLPLLITPLATALRSRMNDTRESAKKAMVQATVLVGDRYLLYIVEQILGVLEQGHRKDAAVFVLHALLDGIREFRRQDSPVSDTNDREESREFSIDSAVGKICGALVAELEDGIGVSGKDFKNPNIATSRAKDADRRAHRVADATELVGLLLDFEKGAAQAFEPFAESLRKTSSLKLESRLEVACRRLVQGLAKNQSMKAEAGLKLAYDLVHKHLPGPAPPSSTNGAEARPVAAFGRGDRVLAELGLQLVIKMLSGELATAEANTPEASMFRSMLEPFLPKVCDALKTRFDSLTVCALKIGNRLVRLPLPSRNAVATEMTETILNVLSTRAVSGSAGEPAVRTSSYDEIGGDGLFPMCLRLASTIVHETGGKAFGPRDKQDVVRGLLHIARDCVTDGSEQVRGAALQYIKSVVRSRIIMPEVYDVMDEVSKMAIQAQSQAAQAACVDLSVHFLMNYPASQKRIRQQVEFFVRNLDYVYAPGRHAAVCALGTAVEKYPQNALAAECEYIYLPLVSVLSNDADARCRTAAKHAIVQLFTRLEDSRTRDGLIETSMTLLGVHCSELEGGVPTEKAACVVREDVDPQVRHSGAAALGCVALSPRVSSKTLRRILASLAAVAVHLVQAEDATEPDILRQVLESAEQVLCPSEVTIDGPSSSDTQKVSREEREVYALSPQLAALWREIPTVVSHTDHHVGYVAARMLGHHFAAHSRAASAKPETNDCFFLLNATSFKMRELIKSLALVLERIGDDEDGLAEQIVKNLLYIGNVLRQDGEEGDTTGSALSQQLQDLGAGASGEEEPGNGVESVQRDLYWMLRRISGMASRLGVQNDGALRRAYALRFLAGAVANWDSSTVKAYKVLFAGPLVRALDDIPHVAAASNKAGRDGAVSLANAAVQSLSTSIQESLLRHLGPDEFYSTLAQIRSARDHGRSERKRRRALEAATDPEKAARKKMRRNVLRAEKRKTNRELGLGKRSWRVTKASFNIHEDRAAESGTNDDLL